MTEDTLYRNSSGHGYLMRPIADNHHRLIIDHLLEVFGLRPGDRIAELGAGTGRYSELLLQRGLEVHAFEPDPVLAAMAETRLAGYPAAHVERCSLTSNSGLDGFAAVVGFHVLHHLNDAILDDLGRLFSRLEATSGFKGWFFLEPNPLNLLFPLMILTHPGMHFSEEKGIWTLDRRRLAPDGSDVFLGTIGLFPPRDVCRGIADRFAQTATHLLPRRSFLRAYSVYGRHATVTGRDLP